MKSIFRIKNKGKSPMPHLTSLPALFIVIVFTTVIIAACKKNNNNPPEPTTANMQLVTDNLVSPVMLTEAPDGSKRLFVVDQVGKIWVIGADGAKVPTPFLDISSKMVTLGAGYDERGLLSLAFHPNYKNNGKLYVFYNAPPNPGGPKLGTNWNNTVKVSEFKVSSGNSNQVDLSTERVVLAVDHPQANHNGGTIAFGPDGFLYISIGDGGSKDDDAAGHVDDWYKVNAGGNAQNVEENLLGKVLRIDVNTGSSYSIPADNPYVGKPGKDEIYAFGFRNPYRFSFDMGGSHQLYLGDAGQSLYEEIDIVTKGGNFGWNVKEGTHCFSTDNDLEERATCPNVDSAGNKLIDPVIEISNAANPKGGIAITIIGGNVYRGSELPFLRGKYIFGLFAQKGGTPNGKVYMANPSTSGLWSYDDIPFTNMATDLGQYLKGFGQDLNGEVYLMTSGVQGPSGTTGKVYKLTK
jgi:glucose/arabinose dehydrogenase